MKQILVGGEAGLKKPKHEKVADALQGSSLVLGLRKWKDSRGCYKKDQNQNRLSLSKQEN